jgi:outer membrane lipoprotein carrier protein
MKVLIIILLTFYQLFAQIKTYQASFIQTVTNPSGKVINYEGSIYIKQPNKMLWKYKTPVEKYVYMDDLKIIIDEPELEQAIYTQLTDEINVISFLNNPKLIDDKYKVTFETKKLKSIEYNDEMENKIKILFKNIKINDNIADQLFQFIAPLDYDIIKK